MKCPFRTIEVIENKVQSNYDFAESGKVEVQIKTLEFNECIGYECPFHYWGDKVEMSSGIAKTISVPKCKRAEV